MSIRTKLLLALLLTAVLPMAAIRAVQAVSMSRLRDRIQTQVREDLTREAQQDLLRVVESYADLLERDSRLVFALLHAQAAEVERRLDGPVPENPGPVFSPARLGEMLEAGRGQLPDVVVSELHGQIQDDGSFTPQTVSYGHCVTLLVEGDGLTDSQEVASKLHSMAGVYRGIWEQAPSLILWQYTVLDNGVHVSYPGKAYYPEDYSPLERQWYRQTIDANRAVRLRPLVDTSTRQVITTFAQPIRDSQGRAVGVTAIDIPLSRVLDRSEINTEWSDQARIVLLTPYRPTANRDNATLNVTALPLMDDVYIAADLDDSYRVRRLRSIDSAEAVHFEDPADRDAVLADLAVRRAGVRRAMVGGEDVMIAYGPVTFRGELPVYAAIIAPTKAITGPAENVIQEVDAEMRASLINSGLVIVVLLLVVAVLAWRLAKRMSRPVVELAEVARRVASGDLSAQMTQTRGEDELAQMGQAFNEMVPKLRDQMQVREALAVAMEVQQALLPDGAPVVPGLEIAGHSEYCDETGGDYYDFIQVDQLTPNTVAVAIGDVTGHGIAAALLMATGRALIRSRAALVGALDEVFTGVNQNLCESRFSGRFMTLFYMLIETNHQPEGPPIKMRYLSAGHDPTLVYRPAEDRFLELVGEDIPLGVDATWAFHELEADDFQEGDVLVAGTDGIWECFNAENEQFGKERMRQAIRASASKSATDIAGAISKAVHDWRGDRDQMDDITMVVMKVVAAKA